jgi:hypothetical protein
MPEVLTQTVPESAVQAQTIQPEAPKESLVTRASKVTIPSQAQPIEGQTIAPLEAPIKLDQATIDRIADPAMKQAVNDAYKSMLADYTRKTQAVASERKQLDTVKQQMEQEKYNVPSLLNDPKWVQAAQEYQKSITPQGNPQTTGALTQEEFSYLAPEQQKAYTETQEAKNVSMKVLNELNQFKQQAAWEREDGQLQSKYANYDPTKVNQIYNDMMTDRIRATREHLWKVQDYDSAVQRAYQLGIQDRQLEQGMKLNASSQPNNISVTPSNSDVPVRQPNQSQSDHWRLIAQNAMKKVGVIK